VQVKAHITVFGIPAGQTGEVDGRRRGVQSALTAGWLTKVEETPAPPPARPAPQVSNKIDDEDEADDGDLGLGSGD
jgi:hypothetical protein